MTQETDRAAQSANKAGRGDPRPYIYASFDFALAIAYAVLITSLAPPYRTGPALLVWSLVLGAVLMGGGMLVRGKWGWRISASACGYLLLLEVVLLCLLVASASFLSGVYGSFGKAGASLIAVAALFSIQMIALVPGLQLKYLLTRAGRRRFGQEPLWR